MTEEVTEMPRCLASLDRTRELDGAAEQQQLFGERGLARVGMGDDGEGATPGDLGQEIRTHLKIYDKNNATADERGLTQIKTPVSFFISVHQRLSAVSKIFRLDSQKRNPAMAGFLFCESNLNIFE